MQYISVKAVQFSKMTLQEELDSQLSGMWPIAAQISIFSDQLYTQFHEIALYSHKIMKNDQYITINEICQQSDQVCQAWRYITGISQLPDFIKFSCNQQKLSLSDVQSVVKIEKKLSDW
eukprot:EST48686.1 Hypothetical protein SS50377_11299 [Spironucleus salmonicida]